jgi:hypothetical protein
MLVRGLRKLDEMHVDQALPIGIFPFMAPPGTPSLTSIRCVDAVLLGRRLRGAGRRLERADCYAACQTGPSRFAERARSPYDNDRGAGRNRTDE